MRISDWSSDVCSSDLAEADRAFAAGRIFGARHFGWGAVDIVLEDVVEHPHHVLDKALVAVPFVPGFEIEAGEAADCGAIIAEMVAPRGQRYLAAQIDRKSTRLNSSH